MKAIVLSDTHVKDIDVSQLPRQFLEDVKSADMILHAGDFVELSVFEKLKEFNKKVFAVSGNMDSQAVLETLPRKQIFQLGKFKVGLIHGTGSSEGLLAYVKNQFAERVDCIIFGHSHNPVNEIIDGVLYFNPGSPTDKVFAMFNSYGILEATQTLRGRIIRI